jgi:NAD(P)-dependent dehydrogenase (short-subunit alcohol dehydrogenase family)
MVNPMDLSGRRVLVTGASSGIGKACAILVAELGASVVLVGRNKERLDDTFSKLEGDVHLSVPFYLTVLDEIKSVFVEACSNGLKLDGLVHAAGILPLLPIQAITQKQIVQAMSINYFSFLLLAKFFSKKPFSNSGSIVAVSSVASVKGWESGTLYCGTKGALDSSIRAMALDLTTKKIRVNSVLPSYIQTPMLDDTALIIGDDALRSRILKQPLGLGYPEDVANAVAFLLSYAARFITGTQLVVDGGYLAQ